MFNKALLRFLPSPPAQDPSTEGAGAYAQAMERLKKRQEANQKTETQFVIQEAAQRAPTDFSTEAMTLRLRKAKLGIDNQDKDLPPLQQPYYQVVNRWRNPV